MIRVGHLVATAVAALIVLSPAWGMSPSKLTGTVGPGFTISLKAGGKAVKTLKAGKYTIAVTDKSAIHNFHLKGPVNKTITTVAFTGTKTVTLTLKKGSYTFVCDPHSSQMKGSFRVT